MTEFKIGDIVECINDDSATGLNKNHRYEIEGVFISSNNYDSWLKIIDDDGKYQDYSSIRFKKVDNMDKNQDNTINHPNHYTEHKSGIECIDVVEHMQFNLGNAIKYIWRHEKKNGVEDLKKAIWYLEREINRQERLK